MTQHKYPKVYLTIDNCFAIKRWVRPREWMKVIHDIGDVACIQASTDNEIDPLFNTPAFRDEWVNEVRQGEKQYGFKVVCFYSGYATYRTVGLTSWAQSSREALKNRYFKKTVDLAAKLGAQVGNMLNAFSEPVLCDPKLFHETEEILIDNLADMARYASDKNVTFGYEQMYTPTQGMWTIEGCIQCMKKVASRADAPMYLTIDTAHQVGQHLFFKPSVSDIQTMQRTGDLSKFHLPQVIIDRMRNGASPEHIHKALDALVCTATGYGFIFMAFCIGLLFTHCASAADRRYEIGTQPVHASE